jgi:hypothetical protein
MQILLILTKPYSVFLVFNQNLVFNQTLKNTKRKKPFLDIIEVTILFVCS